MRTGETPAATTAEDGGATKLAREGGGDDGDGDGGLVGGVEDHDVSEDHLSVAREEGEFVVVGAKVGSGGGAGGDDLMPCALGLVAVHEGVLGDGGLVDAD